MATTCTIQLTGVKAGTGVTVVEEILYNTDTVPVNEHFVFKTFPTTFSNLVEVDVEVVSAAVDTVNVVVLIDNNAYTAYSTT